MSTRLKTNRLRRHIVIAATLLFALALGLLWFIVSSGVWRMSLTRSGLPEGYADIPRIYYFSEVDLQPYLGRGEQAKNELLGMLASQDQRSRQLALICLTEIFRRRTTQLNISMLADKDHGVKKIARSNLETLYPDNRQLTVVGDNLFSNELVMQAYATHMYDWVVEEEGELNVLRDGPQIYWDQ